MDENSIKSLLRKFGRICENSRNLIVDYLCDLLSIGCLRECMEKFSHFHGNKPLMGTC
jgi:hypothetical protein